MEEHRFMRAHPSGFAASLMAAALFVFVAPLAAQIQPQTPAPSLTPPMKPAPPTPQTAAPQTPAPAPAAVPAPTPATLAKGKAIVLAAAKASGGDLLKNIKSVEVHVSGEANTTNGAMDLKLKLTIIFPDHLRSDAELPVGKITQGFDGKAGWIQSPQGLIDLPPDFTPEVARGIALTGGLGLYQQALEGDVVAQYIDDEQYDGKKASVVQWSGPSGPVRLYFDAATHLMIGAHFRAVSPSGETQTDQHWSDFRAVDGIQYPYHNQVDHDGQRFTETTVSDVKVNTNPDPAIFNRPAEDKPSS